MNDGICFEVPQLTPTSVVLTPSPLKRQAYSDPMTPPRELLESLLTAAKDPLRLSPLLQAPSGQILEALRRLGLEGVVGKRIGSTSLLIQKPAREKGLVVGRVADCGKK